MKKFLVSVCLFIIFSGPASLFAANNDVKSALSEWRSNFLNRINHGESSKRLERQVQDAINNMEEVLTNYHIGRINREESIGKLHSCMCDAFEPWLEKIPVELNNLLRELTLYTRDGTQTMSAVKRDELVRDIYSKIQATVNATLRERAIKLFESWEEQRGEKSSELFLNNTGETVSGFFEVFESLVDYLFVIFTEAL